MGDKTNRRDITVDVRWQRAHHGAFIAERDVDQPLRLKLLFQQV